MNKLELFKTWLTAQAIAQYNFVGGITVGFVLGIPIVFLFGDTLLSLLGHGVIALGSCLAFIV